jgi:hypothetical protein
VDSVSPDGRFVAEMEFIFCVPDPNSVTALKRYALEVGTGSPTVNVGKYVLFVGRVKMTVGEYEKLSVVEFVSTPEKTLVAWTPMVDLNTFELPDSPIAVGESILGVPLKIKVPDGSAVKSGANVYDTGLPNLSVNPRPLGNDTDPEGRV